MIKLTLHDSLQKVKYGDKPKKILKKISALKDERVNFFAYIECDKNCLCDIQLKGVSSDIVLVRKLEEIDVKFPIYENADDYILSKDAGKYYDILREHKDKNILLTAGQNNLFFISLCFDKKVQKAGDVCLKVDLKAENECVSKQFLLEIIDCNLKENDLTISNWMHYDCMANEHGVKLFSKEFYNVFDNYLKSYTEHGNNTLLVPLFTPPLDTAVGAERLTAQLVDINYDGEKYSFNFARLNEFLDFITARGIKYFEFSHLFTQWGLEACPKIMVKEGDKIYNKFGWEVKSDDDSYLNFLDAFLKALVEFITKKGIEKNCFFHLSDEPNESHLERYEKLFKFVKQRIGALKVVDALSSFEFYTRNISDNPFVSIDHAKKYIENKAPHSVYNCCIPCNNYYTNRFICFSLARMRALGALMYFNNAKGYLHWGYNFYNAQYSTQAINPYETADALGKFPAGDAFIVYPTNNGCIDSVRHETFLESLQDYRALKTLESLIGEQRTKKFLKNFKLNGYNEYPKSSEKFLKMREKINKKIKKEIK